MYIPTASELFEEYSWSSYLEDGGYATCIGIEDFEKALIDFARLHVQAALKAASENVEVDYNLLEDYNKTLLVDENIEVYAITSSILDSYSLENIK
jgi:hypothetical protein